MPQRRERDRPRELSRDEEHYIILVHDIPRHCRWQELKDMTRSLGGEQSLKAEVFDVGNGTQMGHCTIKGRSDAVKVYKNLCTHGWNGHRVRVKLGALDKDNNLRTIEGPKESNGVVDPARAACLPHQVSQGVAATTNSTSRPLYATSTHSSTSVTYSPQYATMNGWQRQPGVPSPTAAGAPPMPYTSGAFPPHQSYLSPSIHAQAMAPSTHYGPQCLNKAGPTPTSPISSLPLHSINDGTTIFLSGLPYYQSENELRGLLECYGIVTYLEIHPDSRNPGKNKGTARARYKSAPEALDAVRDLDGKYLRDRKISVKQERDGPSIPEAPRRPSQETKNGASSSSKHKKNMAFSSSASSAKSKKVHNKAKGHSRASDRSHDSTFPTRSGPLVVNGARRLSARRPSRGARFSGDSDDSGDGNSDSDKDSGASSDDGDEDVREVTRKMHQHRL